MYLNIIKSICDKPVANIIFRVKIESFSSKILNKTGILTISAFTQYCTRNPCQSN